MTKSPFYSDAFLEEMKNVLLARKDKVLRQLETFTKADSHSQENFNSDFPEYGDEEDDNAAEVAAFEGNLSLEETLEQSLEMINNALMKIDNGTYGICEKTNEPIGEERLRIMPTATKKVPATPKNIAEE